MSGGAQSQTFSIKVDTQELVQFVGEFQEASHQATRPAAQAGAEVLYQAVKRNVSALGRKTGNLANSIYQAYSKSNSSATNAEYHVSWNHIKAPHGRLVEWGHIQTHAVRFDPKTGRFWTDKSAPLAQPKQVGAKPFVRPAIAQFPQAEEAMTERYFAELRAKGLVT